jgi:hypothetical protein
MKELTVRGSVLAVGDVQRGAGIGRIWLPGAVASGHDMDGVPVGDTQTVRNLLDDIVGEIVGLVLCIVLELIELVPGVVLDIVPLVPDTVAKIALEVVDDVAEIEFVPRNHILTDLGCIELCDVNVSSEHMSGGSYATHANNVIVLEEIFSVTSEET